MNVIAVNWEHGADNINYIQAAANTRVVGATIGELIKSLHSTAHASYDKFLRLIKLTRKIARWTCSSVRGSNEPSKPIRIKTIHSY
jgi:hypothetical protein